MSKEMILVKNPMPIVAVKVDWDANNMSYGEYYMQLMHENDKEQIIVLTLYILKRKIYRFYKLKEIRWMKKTI